MARVTVEDCSDIIPSRFELVALAAQRARIIASGGKLTIPRDNDKDAVVALREIAEKTVEVDALREIMVRNCQECVEVDAYGVEEVSDVVKNTEFSSEEIKEELSSMNQEVSEDDAESILYGENELDVQD